MACRPRAGVLELKAIDRMQIPRQGESGFIQGMMEAELEYGEHLRSLGYIE